MHLRKTILFLSVGLQLHTRAQVGKSVHVIRDSRIDKLVEKQIEINSLSVQGRIVIEQGYRLLVIGTNSREKAMEIRATLIKLYPDQKTYMSYQAPNFKVHFGNFRTYRDADRMRNSMRQSITTDMLIIPSKIEWRVNNAETINRP